VKFKFPKIRNPLDYVYPERKTIRRYLGFCEKHPWPFFFVILILTAIAAIKTIDLYSNVDTSLTALLPPYYTSVQTLNRIDQEGSKLGEFVLAEGRNPEEVIAFAEALKTSLEKQPSIFRVKIRREIMPKEYAFLVLHKPLLEEIRDRIKKRIAQVKLKHSGFFVSLDDDERNTAEGSAKNGEHGLSLADIKEDLPGVLTKAGTQDEYFLSRDQKVINIQVFPNNPPSNFKLTEQFYVMLRSEVAKIQTQFPDVTPNFYGPYRKRLDEFQLVQRDVTWIGTFTMIAILGSLILYFRQILPVFVVSLPLGIGLLWTMGLADFLVGRLNTITAFLIGIISGLGVDFCIYIYSRYLEERHDGKSRMEGLTDAVHHTGRAAFTAGLNTALVFLSLTLADFRGFSEFGLIAGIGIIISYLAIYFLLPAFIIWFEKMGLTRPDAEKKVLGFSWPSLPTIIPARMRRFPFSRTIVIFTIGIVVLFFLIFPHIEFEYDFGKLRSDMITYEKEEAVTRRFNFGAPMSNAALLIMNSRDDIDAVKKAIDKKIAEDTETPTIRGFASFHDVWPTPDQQKEKMKIIDEIRSSLSPKIIKKLKGKERADAEELISYLQVKPYPIEDVSKDMITSFSPRNGPIGSYGYVLARYEIRTKDGQDAMRFADDVRDIVTDRGTFHASSQEVVFADILGLMLHESKLTVMIAIALITVFVWLDFWSIPKCLLVLVPVMAGTMLTLIFMYSFGGRITFFNMIVFPLIIGMGEDNAVHLYHRDVSEGRGSICKTMKTTGQATGMASWTNILGFMGLVFSHHKGLQSIGLLATAGLLGCLICSLLVLPALVQVLEDHLPKFPQ